MVMGVHQQQVAHLITTGNGETLILLLLQQALALGTRMMSGGIKKILKEEVF